MVQLMMKAMLPLLLLAHLVSILPCLCNTASDLNEFECIINGTLSSLNVAHNGIAKSVHWKYTDKSGEVIKDSFEACIGMTVHNSIFSFVCTKTSSGNIVIKIHIVMPDVWSEMNITFYYDNADHKTLFKKRMDCVVLEMTYITSTPAITTAKPECHENSDYCRVENLLLLILTIGANFILVFRMASMSLLKKIWNHFSPPRINLPLPTVLPQINLPLQTNRPLQAVLIMGGVLFVVFLVLLIYFISCFQKCFFDLAVSDLVYVSVLTVLELLFILITTLCANLQDRHCRETNLHDGDSTMSQGSSFQNSWEKETGDSTMSQGSSFLNSWEKETDVEDGESVNPTRSDCTPSPYICVSYHKDIQNKVIVLMQHLTSAGFNCWMETDNRDDGDINSRIREADAVICCATEKFIQSSECNRQVSLAVQFHKPIIPLLMDDMTFPTAGSMGTILSKHISVRFFQKPSEETTDERYWASSSFELLLRELNKNTLPNQLHDAGDSQLEKQEDSKYHQIQPTEATLFQADSCEFHGIDQMDNIDDDTSDVVPKIQGNTLIYDEEDPGIHKTQENEASVLKADSCKVQGIHKLKNIDDNTSHFMPETQDYEMSQVPRQRQTPSRSKHDCDSTMSQGSSFQNSWEKETGKLLSYYLDTDKLCNMFMLFSNDKDIYLDMSMDQFYHHCRVLVVKNLQPKAMECKIHEHKGKTIIRKMVSSEIRIGLVNKSSVFLILNNA